MSSDAPTRIQCSLTMPPAKRAPVCPCFQLLVQVGQVSQRALHKHEKEAREAGKASFFLAWVSGAALLARLLACVLACLRACLLVCVPAC